MDVEKRIAEARSLAGATPVAFQIADLDVRSAPKGANSPGGVRFYSAVYGERSLDLGGFREIIAPGFADASIAEDDIRALVNHDANLVLGRSAPAKGVSTAQINSDARGVLVDIPALPNTDYAANLVENLRAGNVDQSSFGFRTVADAWAYDESSDTVVRTLTEARLFDVSVVTFPAYPDTVAEARSIALALAELRVGKQLSAKSREQIQAALDSLTELLTNADFSGDSEANAIERAKRAAADSDGDDEALLDAMVVLGQAFVDQEDDPADVSAMEQILKAIQALEATEEGETNSAPAGTTRGDAGNEAGDGIALARLRLRALELSAPVVTSNPERKC